MLQTISPSEMKRIETNALCGGVPSLLLMERAAEAVVGALAETLHGCQGRSVLFLCGPGNNGGDGLAAARLFAMRGGEATVWLPLGVKTKDAQTNLDYARLCDRVTILETCGFVRPDAAVDALFGTGFANAPQGAAAEAIEKINALCVPVIAVDAPSGLDAETGHIPGACVHADTTVVFHRPKAGLYLTGALEYVGRLIVAPIGLPSRFDDADGFFVAEESDLPALLPPRGENVHKGQCGRVLLYMGSVGLAGAAAMAAKACLRAGAGLATVACPREVIPILQTILPNAMCVDEDTLRDYMPLHDVLATGCGLFKDESVWDNILLIRSLGKPTVWDADALNLLARHDLRLGKEDIITPHVVEAERLLSVPKDEILRDMPAAARALHDKYGCCVVLKNAVTVIDDGHRRALNAVGTPALAKGGSGDALCGIISALRCHLSPFDAARAACLWHGMAGRSAAARRGVYGVLTTEMIDEIKMTDEMRQI